MLRHGEAQGLQRIEVVVVLFFAILLGSLLMPAMAQIFGPSKKTICTNNLRNVAIALQTHEAAKGMLPGWANRQDARYLYTRELPDGVETRQASWVFPILPFLERDDVFRQYSGPAPAATTEPTESIKILKCPSDKAAVEGSNLLMSYVANCGLRELQPGEPGVNAKLAADGKQWGDQAGSAMFYNSTAGKIRSSIGFAAAGDGASNTFLLSENADAGKWTEDWEDRVGFCWVDMLESPISTVPADKAKDVATMTPNSGPLGKNRNDLPRASSFHPKGFNVAFADSHSSFLNSDIDWQVYIRLFTPNGQQVQFRPYTKEPPAKPDVVTREIQAKPLQQAY